VDRRAFLVGGAPARALVAIVVHPVVVRVKPRSSVTVADRAGVAVKHVSLASGFERRD